jgi:hypothetical protein
MKKFLITSVLAVVIVTTMMSCCTKVSALNNNKIGLSKNILKSGGAIMIENPFGGKVAIGSATFVEIGSGGKGIVTAQHVAEIQSLVPVSLSVCSFADMNDCIELNDNYIMDTSESIATDWAVFEIESFPESAKPAKVRKRLPPIGEEIIICGIPQGYTPWLSYGHVGYVWLEDNIPIIGVDGFAFFGSSGGGVYDSEGYLIGVTSAISASEWGPIEDKVLVTPITNIPVF